MFDCIFYRTGTTALVLACALALANSALAAVPPLRIVVDSSTAMPMSQIIAGEVTEGIHYDIGVALAAQLGTRARFTAMPRKRIGVTLEQGAADLSCHFLPSWLPGNFDWTVPFMPNATLLISTIGWQAPASIDAVRGIPVGTVLGFNYPEIQQALGNGFVRDDAVDAMQSLTKFAAGRTRHALTGEVFFSYQQRLHPYLLQVHRPILVTRFAARCAISRHGRYSAQQLDHAIGRLQKSHQIDAIYAKYR
ncbi:substrate-binding periplasmic protein [Massilia sp. PWRC2]|uniref:substrate-binding periplasmic protein n=1 Tax=Massilia sp. PWRC2 TaxID=2804626 RepID=UPI003CF8D41B